MRGDSVSEPTPPTRGTIRGEVLVVLALSFFASSAYAVLSLASRVLGESQPFGPIRHYDFPRGVNGFTLAYGLLRDALQVVPVALVAHLFARDGGSLADIGLESARKAKDAMWAFGLGSGALLLNLFALSATHALGIPFRDQILVNPGAHPVYILLLVTGSAAAALSEEVIVNAYLQHRLLQLAWSPTRVIVASAALRASYHLYQGEVAFFGHLIAGLLAAWIYQRTRRLWPLIGAHFMFDAVVLVAYLLAGPLV